MANRPAVAGVPSNPICNGAELAVRLPGDGSSLPWADNERPHVVVLRIEIAKLEKFFLSLLLPV